MGRCGRIPIAAALMDQSVLAGVGNVYRAESLFAVGLDPDVAGARRVAPETVDALWRTLVEMLRDGERAGKIVTVDRADEAGVPRSKLRGRDRVQVYRRTECRRCGGPVWKRQLTGRTLVVVPGLPTGAALTRVRSTTVV